MKIAYITRHIPIPSETFVINEIIALQSLGVDIYPVSILPAQRCHEHLLAQIRRPILDLSSKEQTQNGAASSFYSQAVKTAEYYRIFTQEVPLQAALIAEMINKNGIELIHAHFATESAWVALVASRIAGVPFSFTAHAYDIFITDLLLQSEYPFTERLNVLIRDCDRVITVSEYNKKHLISKTDEIFGNKIAVVHCGIDPGLFTLQERPARDTITILTVGRFVKKKGYEFLLQAFAVVATGNDRVRLRIVGDGHLKADMEDLCRELQIAEKVDFLGSVSSEQVAEKMQNADVFALHSVTDANGDKEGIPVSLMEAMATGLPVVSTKHSGISELVVDGVAGFLTEEKDVDTFAAFINTLADSPDLRIKMGTAGHYHVVTHFNLHKEAEKLHEEFRALVTEKRPALSGAECSVAIILPTYRPDLELLTRAVRSIVEQTFANWRLILVQDGNDCDLSPLVAEFNDPRITYHELPHAGKPAALNFALNIASAKYIAYLDDDDIWYPNHLEETVSCMSRNKIRFLHTNGLEIFLEKQDNRFTEVSRRRLNKGLPTNKILWYVSHINAIHERELLAETGPYDESRPYFIDWDMFLRLAKVAKPYFLDILTCEHYIYQSKNKQINNTISSAHAMDPELSQKRFGEMVQRAFAEMSPFDIVDIFQDWQRVAALDQQVAERDLQLTERNQQLAERNLQLAERDQQLAESNQQLAERDQQLVESNQQLAERDQQLAEIVRQLGERTQQLAGKDQQLKHKQLEIKDLHNSLSWKITKPLRSTLDKLTNSPLTKPLLRKANKVLQQATVDSTQPEPRGPSLEELNRHDPLVIEAIAAQEDSYDVIVFPVIDWHFRVQRPQHLASNLAALGHRVFYLTTTFSHEWPQPGFRIMESPAANVFIVQLNFPLPHPANIYQGTVSAAQRQLLIAALEQLRNICHIRQTVSVVDLPFWRPVVEGLSGNLVIYDCMDHHAGFSTNDKQMLLEEKHLLASADLVVVSSQRLSEIVGQERENVIIRNGADVAMFAQRPAELAYKATRPVIGYYGAISEWFDMELVIAAARALPDWDFVLVGSTFGCKVEKAEKIPNIIFTGEVPYASLTGYLYAFDVCTIPFLLTELTLCTNPVKVYEYLSAGKPVVTTAMPELQLIRDQLHIAESAPEFIEKLKIAMAECNDTTLAGQRAAWAQQHDWRARAKAVEKEIQPFYPKASVIVLTYNNIDLTKACLESLNTYTAYPDWELIIVDNASADGTPAYLQEFAAHHANAKVILNDTNLGFAAGNNVGMKAATGDYLVILNNDTVVTNGWLFDLIRHLRRDPSLGLVGPVTNSIGNEAQIETTYQAMEEMHIAALQYTSAHARKLMHIRNVAFFCVALRRDVMERVGLLDEAFTVGFFEDDDYCRRIHGAGLSIAIAEDVFVHHEHSASFNALASERKKEIFEKNKKVYEAKWGEWVPHVYR